MRKALFIIIMMMVGGNAVHPKAQIPPSALEKALAEQIKQNVWSLGPGSQVKEFYKYFRHNIAWITNDLHQDHLLNYLERRQILD